MPCSTVRLCGISSHFWLLSPCIWQVTHALLTRPPLSYPKIWPKSRQRVNSVRLACVKHAASVHPEPGSNSLKNVSSKPKHRRTASRFFPSRFARLIRIKTSLASFIRYCFFRLYLFDTLWIFSWIFRVALLFICQGALSCICFLSNTQRWYIITSATPRQDFF